MSDNTRYQVRDPQGNIYGPADAAALREWVQQGRIVAGMHIADQADGQWVEVSVHPALADLFQGAVPGAAGAASPVATVTPVSSMPTPMAVGGPMTPTGDPGTLGYDSQPPRQNVLGLISLIAGAVGVAGSLCGIACCLGWPLAGILGLTAVVLGAIALMQFKSEPVRYTGRGLAVAGLCLGIGSLVLVVAGVIVRVILLGRSF